MASVNPYLIFNDNCEEAFRFYHGVFGGPELEFRRFKEMPKDHCGAGEENKVMHVFYPLKDGTALMGSDRPAQSGTTTVGDNFSVCIFTESREEADRIFQGLSVSGKVEMPMGETFWGAYYGMFVDKFGVNWMVHYYLPPKQ
ncbi:PhnB protein [Chitinophaga skermanii]|uniref:PhnB protein n=1 Tax=Chitinophaga skermanii TaxID=331697 RepID=A0A327QXJ1_9BACT|nr:VOC family protein [Chitinophaga skermanii]RAJ08444.1 PhnB protein [Chitinophaga skermanii]